MIRYQQIHKAFEEPVLSGVDLTVNEGEMFGLFGPSGTGKSVLLKTTIGLIIPDQGDVFLKGESVFFGESGCVGACQAAGGIRLPALGSL